LCPNGLIGNLRCGSIFKITPKGALATVSAVYDTPIRQTCTKMSFKQLHSGGALLDVHNLGRHSFQQGIGQRFHERVMELELRVMPSSNRRAHRRIPSPRVRTVANTKRGG
jgi:hypothetical protein